MKRGSPNSLDPAGARALLLDLGALIALFAVVCGGYLRGAFQAALPGGWDGVPHHAIADLYARKLFPAINGWLDAYFAGMSYPTFYPPVFYMAVASITKLGVATRAAFWAVQTAGFPELAETGSPAGAETRN